MINRLGFQQTVGRVGPTFQGTAIGVTNSGGRFGVVPIIGKTDFLFDGRAGSTQTIVLAEGIDATGWKSCVIEARLHASVGWTASASLIVFVRNVAIVPEDPSVVFPGFNSPSRSFLPTDPAGTLSTTAITGFGAQVEVSLQWVQGATAATGAQTASISVNLVARPR